MRREFSTILILLLLILSPLSYSSEEIPDFGPDCPVTETYGLRMIVAGIDGSARAAAPRAVPAEPVTQYVAPRILVPHVVWSKTSSFGRAPPA